MSTTFAFCLYQASIKILCLKQNITTEKCLSSEYNIKCIKFWFHQVSVFAKEKCIGDALNLSYCTYYWHFKQFKYGQGTLKNTAAIFVSNSLLTFTTIAPLPFPFFAMKSFVSRVLLQWSQSLSIHLHKSQSLSMAIRLHNLGVHMMREKK